VAADPNKVYRLKTDGEAVLISDADTLDAFARWSGWDGVEHFLEGMKMNANDLLNRWFYVTGGTCHLCVNGKRNADNWSDADNLSDDDFERATKTHPWASTKLCPPCPL
jgi:hypothetical protein